MSPKQGRIQNHSTVRSVRKAAVSAGCRLRSLLAMAFAVTASALAYSQSVDVSSSGLPGYAYPITVPPGIAGMAPNIGLSYNGGGVNGPVGYGWSLQGISTITRCAHTRAIDGYTRGVAYDGNDKLCLDGQRLIQVDPSTGATVNGAVTSPSISAPFQQNDSQGLSSGVREFRTEKDTFARIRAYGMVNGASDGPKYFKVWTKSGQVYEYGNNANTTANALVIAQGRTVAAAWAVSRISDTLGNYIDFQYEQRDTAWGSVAEVNTSGTTPATGREWNLSEIRYTGTSTSQPQNKVQFVYEDRPDHALASKIQDRAESYHLGSKNVSIRRLSQILTQVNVPSSSITVKVLKLAYGNGVVTQRSLLQSITECVGASASQCLPATAFTYTAGGSEDYTASSVFSAGALHTTTLQDTGGDTGILTGDFNGDGRTDILKWSSTPANNKLYLSAGDGSFTSASNFNLTTQKLFTSNGCYESLLSDVNGDGVPDIVRYSAATNLNGVTCSSYGATEIYLSNVDGSFTVKAYSGPVLERLVATYVDDCLPPGRDSYGDCAEPAYHAGWTRGANFYFFDIDGDGLPDLLTSVLPAYDTEADKIDPCLSQICTKYYKGKGDGSFELKTTNLANSAVYIEPKKGTGFGAPSRLADLDGDGLLDINGLTYRVTGTGVSTANRTVSFFNKTTAYRSQGDGNFDTSADAQSSCAYSIDFNGDGRNDCLQAAPYASTGTLNVFVAANRRAYVNNFNLGTLVIQNDGYGTTVLDVNGDGRQDFLRYADTATETTLYLSQGDGTFQPSSSFNINNATKQLFKTDGTTSFVTGDFTGRGNVEFLRIKSSPSTGSASGNQLYLKTDATPPDLLKTVTTGTGLSTQLTWVPLSNSSSGTLGTRYKSDRSDSTHKAVYPKVDIIAPIYVVASAVSSTGVGAATVSTEYGYTGLKAAYDSRGGQGFRETRRQTLAPNGATMVTATQYLQDYPYTGVARDTATWLGVLTDTQPASPLSSTSYIYCNAANQTAQSTATSRAPCSLPAGTYVQQPYLYKSTEQGKDLLGNALPTVETTNSFNSRGDPLTIEVVSTGTSAGVSQTFKKKTSNTYDTELTSCSSDTSCYWILGRLATVTQENTAPATLSALGASAGTASNATAITGTVVLPVLTLTQVATTGASTATTPASVTYRVGNTGQVAASGITYTGFSGVTLSSGPATCAGSTTDCGNVVVTTGTAAATYSGTLTATPTSGTAASAAVSLTVRTPTALTLTQTATSGSTTTPTAATITYRVSNTGQTAASSISYNTISGATVSGGPTSCAASTTDCGSVVVTTGTAAGTYSGTLTATPNSGTAASAAVSLTVKTQPALTLTQTATSGATTTPTAATITYRVSNTGQTAATSISYTSISGATVSGPSSCAAGITDCGSVVVTTGTAAGTYSGTLTATPNSGAAASTAVSLTVYTKPALALTQIASSGVTTTPTAATVTYRLSNTGQTTASGIGYGSFSGASVSGPASCAANTADCGNVVVTSSTAAGAYSGTITATPSDGTGASASTSLTVYTQPALTLTLISSSGATTAPTAATATYRIGNTGQTAASSIAYAGFSGASVSGPASCAAGATDCGSVTVTSSTTAGSYSGTVSATPNLGSGASVSVTLLVKTIPTLVLTQIATSGTTTAPTPATATYRLGNSGQTDATALFYYVFSGVTATGPSSCAANTADCGNMVVTSGTGATTYSGTVQAAVINALSNDAAVAVNLVVTAPPTTTLSASPSPLAFGSINQGSSVSKTLTVTNSGSVAATGLQYLVSTNRVDLGEYSLTGKTCPAAGGSLAAGASCNLTFQYVSYCGSGTGSGSIVVSGSNFSAVTTTASVTLKTTGVCK
jgi:Salmonella virulence plasmid 65kDa B protein/FG-GAP-like repeat